MRMKNKITRKQHRVKKAQKQESKVLYFAQDPLKNFLNCIHSNVMHLKKSSKQNIITLLKSKKYGLA